MVLQNLTRFLPLCGRHQFAKTDKGIVHEDPLFLNSNSKEL